MELYLPIAEMAVNPLLMAGLGMFIGALSGLFGVGGGFLTTPLLILAGIPAPVAVATGSNLAAAAAMSSTFDHWVKRTVDVRMALLLTVGGGVGALLGVQVLSGARSAGLDEALISIAYVLLLSFIGGGMVWESLRALRRARAGEPAAPWSRRHGILQRLPLQMRFPRSGLYVSAIPPVVLGVAVGVLAAIMGVGGGFILVPAMIYLLHMPARTVVGTSLFQILLLSSFVTLLQAIVNGSVDIVLAGLMIVGAVVGAQVGGLIGRRLQSEQIRVLLGALVLAVALALAGDLFIAPSDLFSVTEIGR